MIFIITVVSLTTFSFSQANFHHKPINVIMWDGIAKFYNEYAGADADPFSAMLDDDRRELCSAVEKAPRFIVTSKNDADIISEVVANINAGCPIQRTTVLIGDKTAERTIMVCEHQNGGTFYLGKSHNESTYFLFATSDKKEPPKLSAAVKLADYMSWMEDTWVYPHGKFGEAFHRTNIRFCRIPDHDILNLCASIHRARVKYEDKRCSYTLELEPGSYNHCEEQFIESPRDLKIPIATCKVKSYTEDNSFITYRLTPHPTDNRITFLVKQKERREDVVYIIVQLQRYV